MALQIFIARHGQNQDNANGILNGHRDLPLTTIGLQQAQDLAVGINEVGLQFDHVYCSPLLRAHQTAQIVCERNQLPDPTILPELIERDFGIMTGKPQASITELCAPDIIQADVVTYFLNPEGAETFPDLIKRAERVLEIIESKHADGNILLVGHGDFGKMIYAAATKTPWEDVLVNFHFGNGDLIEVSPSGESHVIRLPQHNS